MCFGSAFIGSNLTSAYRVASVLLSHKPDFDVVLKISPIDEKDSMTEADQKASGVEDAELIKYNQVIALFNTTHDYYGKSKVLTMNYNTNMLI